jgi:hypothetical protein
LSRLSRSDLIFVELPKRPTTPPIKASPGCI